jgi:condensin complex subunit 1
MVKVFHVPSVLQDLERDPYNLLPYPEDFDDDDEAARAQSFDLLVTFLETSNRIVDNSSMLLFDAVEEDEEEWNNEERMQALYTLVR